MVFHEAIYDLLARLDLDALSYELRHRAGNDASQQRKNEALKRLQVVESFRASRGRNKPEWMIVRIVPVIPPELRPLVPFIIGGKSVIGFAHIDYFQLYVYRFSVFNSFRHIIIFLHEFSGLIHNLIIGRISFGFEGTHLMADDQLAFYRQKFLGRG